MSRDIDIVVQNFEQAESYYYKRNIQIITSFEIISDESSVV